MKSSALIKMLEADGWNLVGTRGSHHYFKHTIKKGKVTVPHPKKRPASKNGSINFESSSALKLGNYIANSWIYI
ncbi:type II toxin-antitoxin system HicA family toxin [Marinospirillum insulare]|uniref:HicA toxin of toxin-antitoxin n=1 Tax=Marinospirillum insulare TaxID=217169 RepID=A0ABQ5ZUT7_9GAMM|nr:type II toxin-antitoxin system HicA family toxin [Marinospirillum insulare]GLR63221.1 hypothetical protein GCM10007878_06560 [Marinospirillum insulare]